MLKALIVFKNIIFKSESDESNSAFDYIGVKIKSKMQDPLDHKLTQLLTQPINVKTTSIQRP